MKFPSVLRILGAVALSGVFGCQAIAGLQTRNADPPPGVGCTLPTTGAGSIRLVNLATVAANGSATTTDFCVRVSGTSDWGWPIFYNGGVDYPEAGASAGTLCTQGLGYSQATVPFAVDIGSKVAAGGTGKIDVKAIPAGKACSVAGTSEADGVTVGDHTGTPPANPVVTILRYGGGESTKEAIVPLPEEPGQPSNGSNHIRVVNALNGSESVNFGFAAGTTLPTTVTPGLSPAAPGTVATAPATASALPAMDAEGYVPLMTGEVAYAFSNASDKANTAFAVFSTPVSAVDTGTLYAIGDPSASNQSTFPVRGLFCNETVNASASDGGVVVGSQEGANFAQCTPTAFSSLSIDAWDVGLFGNYSPFWDQRDHPIALAVAARSPVGAVSGATDIMCLTEVDDLADRQLIATTAGDTSQLKYSYMVDTTVNTPATNPAEQNGSLPPVDNNPPCAGIDSTIITNAYNCVEQNCSTNTTEPANGTLTGGTTCIESKCAAAFLQLLYVDPTEHEGGLQSSQCFDCILWNLNDPTETIQTSQTTCTTVGGPAWVFQGQMPLLILSRFPLTGTKSYNFTSTGTRRGALKAQVEYQPGQMIDFFCSQLDSSQVDSNTPYVGPYGADHSQGHCDAGVPTCSSVGENGWYDEQLWQAKQLVAWVTKEVGNDNVPAIIAGHFYSTMAYTPPTDAGADYVLAALDPLTMQTLDNSVGGAFQRAEPNGYLRHCDTCPDNPYTAGQTAYEYGPLFLYNFPANQIKTATNAETIWANDPSTYIPITTEGTEAAPPGGKGALSTYYAHNWLIVRPTQ